MRSFWETLFSPARRLGHRTRPLSPIHWKSRFFCQLQYHLNSIGLGRPLLRFHTRTPTHTRKTQSHTHTHTHLHAPIFTHTHNTHIYTTHTCILPHSLCIHPGSLHAYTLYTLEKTLRKSTHPNTLHTELEHLLYQLFCILPLLRFRQDLARIHSKWIPTHAVGSLRQCFPSLVKPKKKPTFSRFLIACLDETRCTVCRRVCCLFQVILSGHRPGGFRWTRVCIQKQIPKLPVITLNGATGFVAKNRCTHPTSVQLSLLVMLQMHILRLFICFSCFGNHLGGTKDVLKCKKVRVGSPSRTLTRPFDHQNTCCLQTFFA